MAAALHIRSVCPLARLRLRDICDAAATLCMVRFSSALHRLQARRCGLHRFLWRGQERGGDAVAAMAARCARQHDRGASSASTEQQQQPSGHRETAFAELQRRWREQNPSQLRQRPSLMPSDELRRQWTNQAKRVQYWTDGDAREEKKRRQRRRYGQDTAARAAQQQRSRAQQAAWRDWVHADTGTHAAYNQAWKEYYATRRRGRRSMQRQQSAQSHHDPLPEGQSLV